MGRQLLIPETVRCSECRSKYHMGTRFPGHLKFEFQVPQSVSEQVKDEILKHLSVAISSFSDYVHLTYGLNARTIEMQVNFDASPEAQASDSWIAIEQKESNG